MILRPFFPVPISSPDMARTRAVRRLLVLAWVACWSASVLCSAGEVVIVKSGNAAPYEKTVSALRRSLEKSGHRSRDVLLSDLSPDRIKGMQADISSFFAVGTRAAVYLKEHLPETVALAYCMVADPEDNGLTKRKNTFGVKAEAPLVDQFDLISKVLPGSRRIGVLYCSKNGASRKLLQRVRAACSPSWKLEAIDIESHASIALALEELFRRRPNVVWTAADRSVYSPVSVRALLLAALRHRTPVFGFSAPVVRAGALIGIEIDPARQGERAALLYQSFIGRGSAVFDGRSGTVGKQAHVASEMHVVVNLRVSKQLGVKLPDDVLRSAKNVFSGKGRRR